MTTETAAPARLNPRLLYELTRSVAAARTLDEIYDAALTCLAGSLGATRSSILLFDEDGVMRFKAWRNLSEGYRQAVDGHSPWNLDTVAPEPVLVPDIAADQSLSALRDVIRAEGIGSLAFFPLLLGRRLLGKFMVYYDQPHEFSDDEVMVAQTIAAQVAFAVDLRQTRELDELVRENEQKYGALIQALGVAVYTTDADGYITLYNEAAVELWGRRPELGKDMWCGSWKLFYPNGDPMSHDECPMGLALKGNRAVRGHEIIAERPNGDKACVLPYPTPLHDAAGRMIGAVNVLVDITAQKKAQSDLLEALRAKDDFLGQVSHELRTPLTQLVGNAHLLVNRWDALNATTRSESLQEVHLQSQRLHRLVENMMVLSRLERGITPDTEPLLVQRLLSRTVDEFQSRYPATSVELCVPEGLWPVDTNASTIDQVLWNLLTNAQKYGPKDGPIRVSAANDGDCVRVSVVDHGSGVAPSEMAQLFDPYFRSPSTSEHAAGLGLGLSVCMRLMESQGGEMVARRLEPGMEFAMRLPALRD